MDAGKRDEETRGAAKGGDASGRHLAAKGRENHLGQGDEVWPALDGVETFAAATQRGTSWPPWQAQLTKSGGCCTHRRHIGADGDTEVGMLAADRGGWHGAKAAPLRY